MVLKIPMFNSSPDEGISDSTISNFKVKLQPLPVWVADK